MTVKILHNPKCSKSRATLAILADKGVSTEVVEYLNTPPSAHEISQILDKLGMTPRDLMRKGEAEYKDNNLADEGLTSDQLIQAMVDHPKLIERPVVLANGKARIGRPPESVIEIL